MKYLYRYLYYVALAFWFIRRPKVAGAGVILENNDSLLLVRHTYGKRNLWRFPGGGRKLGENSLDAARRELKEELGVIVALELLGQVSGVEDWRKVTGDCFFGKLNKQDLISDKKEIEEFKWWPITSLPFQMSPITTQMVNLYISKVLTRR